MKKNFLIIPGLILMLALAFFSCEKKDTSGIKPGYKEDSGTGGNPFPNNPTVTGTPTSTNPATQNSNLQVGGTGWSNPTCASTQSITLKGINGSIDVTLTFFTPPTVGTATYVIAAAATSSLNCAMVVNNAPNQPSGTVWYGKSGLVSVNTTTSSINASFSGVICTQQNFNFPQVSVSGNLGCN